MSLMKVGEDRPGAAGISDVLLAVQEDEELDWPVRGKTSAGRDLRNLVVIQAWRD